MSATIEYRRVYRRAADNRIHAVVAGEPAAVCGREPAGGRSGVRHDRPDCPACRRKPGMGPLPAPRTEGGAR